MRGSQKAAAIFAAWLFLEPLLALGMLVFWGRQRELVWLPMLLPTFYLGIVGGTLHSVYWLRGTSINRLVGHVAVGFVAALLVLVISVVLHDVIWLVPLNPPVPILAIYLLLNSLPFSMFVYFSMIKAVH